LGAQASRGRVVDSKIHPTSPSLPPAREVDHRLTEIIWRKNLKRGKIKARKMRKKKKK
jgi:hypothetical protein